MNTQTVIYLDNNATTSLLPEVRAAMEPFWTEHFGNPSSAHRFGRLARKAIEDAREQIAHYLGAFPDELIFTSGATEANNLAVFGLPRSRGVILASGIEHPSVREAVAALVQRGFSQREFPVGSDGIVDADAFDSLCHGEVQLACLMLANNETGALQPVQALATICQERRIPVHCDAVQAVGKIPVHFHELGVSTLSFSGHKVHGPKGIGGLLVRRGVRLTPLFHGGHQERGRRPGTEPVPLIVGLAKAIELAHRDWQSRFNHVRQLRQVFLDGLRRGCAPIFVNGPEHDGLPHTLNISFPGCRAEVLLMRLDLAGIACSAGSACSSGSLLPSPVLQAMQLPEERLRSAVRFSFSHLNTLEEVERAVARIADIVRELRQGSDEDLLLAETSFPSRA
ncbi:MAG: cysteine desulfurase family protein [Gemmatales bacterium]|nr:cysteine desulfurase [Gemmatales bacterium]MDW7993726.1 cysteine desulfurase family protein [Gemmatales bacterium]